MRYNIKKGDLVRLPANSIVWGSKGGALPRVMDSPTFAIVLGTADDMGMINIFCDGSFYTIKEYEVDKVEEPNYADASC